MKNIITPNHEIQPRSRLYIWISISPDAPRADIGANLAQRPQPETFPNNKPDVWLTVHRNSVWIRKTN